MPAKPKTFEAALGRLDEIVSSLDRGDTPMDDALKLFGEGAELVALCTKKLEAAKLKVETIFPEDAPAEDSDDDTD